MIILIFVVLILLILIGTPIAFAVGLSTLVHYFNQADPRIFQIFLQQFWGGINSTSLLALPLFLFAGYLMNTSGITKRIIDFADTLVGHWQGGLGQVNIVSSMFFAGISGSAISDTAAIGSVLIPSMAAKGYGKGFSGAVTAASAIVGPIIPPSIIMVVYGATFNVSIGALFIAGILPGLAIGFSQMIITYVIARKKNMPKREGTSLSEIKNSFLKAFWALLMPLIIIGGITSGYFTASEASAVAALYAFIIGLTVGDLKLGNLPKLLKKTAHTTASVMILIGFSGVLRWIFALERVPRQVTQTIFSISDSRIIILLLINLTLFIMGMFIGRTANVLLFGPIFIPMMASLGMHELHIAMVIIFTLGIGHLTPPVGMALFTAANVGDVSMEEITKHIWPYLIGIIILAIFITFFAPITMYLPNLLM